MERLRTAFVAAVLVSSAFLSESTALARGDDRGPLRWSIACPLDDCSRPLTLTYESDFHIPNDAKVAGTPIGGLSGLDATGPDSFVAISDDRSEKAPARAVSFRYRIDREGRLAGAASAPIFLHQEDGSMFPSQSIDPESIRSLGSNGFVVSSEGNPEVGANPVIFQFRNDGKFVRQFAPPSDFNFAKPPSAGSRKNLGFEGVAVLDDGNIVAASESALIQDGPVATAWQGSINRLLEFDGISGQLRGQYRYTTDPVARQPEKAASQGERGISEIVGLRGRQILVLEREVYPNQHFEAALYLAELPASPNEVGLVRKTKIFDFREAGLEPDNLEGLALLRDHQGRLHLLVCSDNNFSPYQRNQFLLFRIEFAASSH